MTPPECPSTFAYDVMTDASSNTQGSVPTGLGQPDDSVTPHKIVPGDISTLNTYSFHMKVTGSGLFTYSQHLGPYSLQVACSSDSSITAGDFTGLQ